LLQDAQKVRACFGAARSCGFSSNILFDEFDVPVNKNIQKSDKGFALLMKIVLRQPFLTSSVFCSNREISSDHVKRVRTRRFKDLRIHGRTFDSVNKTGSVPDLIGEVANTTLPAFHSQRMSGVPTAASVSNASINAYLSKTVERANHSSLS